MVVVRREERAIYTHRQIQPFRSASKVPTQIAGTSSSIVEHYSNMQTTGLARLSSELPAATETFGFHQDFRQIDEPGD